MQPNTTLGPDQANVIVIIINIEKSHAIAADMGLFPLKEKWPTNRPLMSG
jgi:hypothetical protein